MGAAKQSTLVVLFTCGLVGLLIGCGSTEATTSSTADAPPETVHEEADSETVAQAPNSFTPNFWIESESEQPDGSSARQRMELGGLSAAGDFQTPRGFAGLANTCDVDYQRDAFLPGKLTVENTTKRFPIEITSGIMIGVAPYLPGEGPKEELVADVAQDFSTGQSCEANAAFASVEFELSSGETGRHSFLIVVHEYYSPAYPQGRKSALNERRVGIANPIPLATDWEQTCVSASVPLDGEFARPDGEPITEHQFDSDLPPC